MANYLTTDTELQSVANAIRTKGGTSEQLSFPEGFVSAIEAISGGGIQGGYNVTFKVNGDDYAIVSCVAGNAIEAPKTPIVGGYHFNGWATTSGAQSSDVVFPYTPSGDTTLYAVMGLGQGATITGLGNSNPASVSFNVDASFFTNVVSEVTYSGNSYIRFNKVYRKINTTSDGQITSISLADTKIDNTYSIYPVFLKEDGATEMDYVLMGKYCTTSDSSANSVNGEAKSLTIGAGRTLCRNKGAGYQQMDWQFFKLWQDLLCAKMQTVNTNSGAGIETDQLGVVWKQNNANQYPWIDGVNIVTANKNYVFSYKPSAYVDSATPSTANYVQAGYTYTNATSGKEISKLGYDSSNPFFTYPVATVDNSTYDTYYCDTVYYGTSATHPVFSPVGNAFASYGAFRCSASFSWSDTFGVRLCYRPVSA